MVTAQEITAALGGKYSNGSGMARCPCHDDREPSLSIRDGRKAVLFKCFAGCTSADIVTELKRQGLWPETKPRVRPVKLCDRVAEFHKPKPDDRAMDLWRPSTPAAAASPVNI